MGGSQHNSSGKPGQLGGSPAAARPESAAKPKKAPAVSGPSPAPATESIRAAVATPTAAPPTIRDASPAAAAAPARPAAPTRAPAAAPVPSPAPAAAPVAAPAARVRPYRAAAPAAESPRHREEEHPAEHTRVHEICTGPAANTISHTAVGHGSIDLRSSKAKFEALRIPAPTVKKMKAWTVRWARGSQWGKRATAWRLFLGQCCFWPSSGLGSAPQLLQSSWLLCLSYVWLEPCKSERFLGNRQGC